MLNLTDDFFFSGSGESGFNIDPTNPPLNQNDLATLIAGIVGLTVMCLFMTPLYCEMISDCKKNDPDCCKCNYHCLYNCLYNCLHI